MLLSPAAHNTTTIIIKASCIALKSIPVQMLKKSKGQREQRNCLVGDGK